MPVVDQRLSSLGVIDHVVVGHDLHLPCIARFTALGDSVVLLQPELSLDGPPSAAGCPPFMARVWGPGEG